MLLYTHSNPTQSALLWLSNDEGVYSYIYEYAETHTPEETNEEAKKLFFDTFNNNINDIDDMLVDSVINAFDEVYNSIDFTDEIIDLFY